MPGLQAASSEVRPRQVTAVVRADSRTGKLVRSVVITPKAVPEHVIAPVLPPAADAAPEEIAKVSLPEPTGGAFDDMVNRIAKDNDLPPSLVHSVIRVESNYNPFALSPKGAMGMMQLIPATARRFGVDNAFNPKQNVEGGVKYLKHLLELYKGNYALALAAYNAGEGAVAKYGGIPPYAETQNYVQSVHNNLKKLKAATPPAKEAAPAAKPKDPSAPNSIQEIVSPDGTVRYVTK